MILHRYEELDTYWGEKVLLVCDSSMDYEVLKNSVNPVRMKNNPVALSVEDIDIIYHGILGDKQK